MKNNTISDTERRRIAHRMLDVILSSGCGIFEEISLTTQKSDSFETIVNQYYRAAMQARMQKEDRWARLGQTDVDISVLLDSGTVRIPGLILKADDFRAFDKDEMSYTRNGVQYLLERGRKGANQWLTLRVMFGYCYNGSRPWWSRQTIEINPTMSIFRCPLCNERTDELFLSGHPSPHSEHFGCIACTATLDPEQRKLYEKTRGKKKPAAIAQLETSRDLVTV